MSILQFLPVKELWSIIQDYQHSSIFIRTQKEYNIIGNLLRISLLLSENNIDLSVDTQQLSTGEICLYNLPKLTKLKHLSVSNSDGKYIKINSKLLTLSLRRVTDINTKSLQNITSLKVLRINYAYNFTDEDLYNISKLKNLVRLTLCGLNDITNTGISYLQKLNLYGLDLFNCNNLTNKVAKYISLMGVVSLSIFGRTKITGNIIGLLDHKKIKYLYMDIHIDPISLKDLEKFDLVKFRLSYCTNQHLYRLNNKNIKTLILYPYNKYSSYNYTLDALNHFKKYNPKVKVIMAR